MLKDSRTQRGMTALVFATFMLAGLPSVHAETAQNKGDADEIMLQVDQRYTGDTQISTSVLTLIDKRDRKRVRDLKMFSLENDDVEKSIIFFLSPSDVQGTAYMTFDWASEQKEDDSWLYLPALQRVRRVASSDESGSFMGSDFSYADINGLDYEDFDYRMINDSEMVDGNDCWVVESVPKNEKIIEKTGYRSLVSWVRKDIHMVVQSKIELTEGRRTKYFSATNIEDIDGIWTAKTLQMVTTRSNEKEHASVFQFGDIVYNQDVDASLFDTQAMKRGI